jgi:hypothetical protein
LRRPRERRYQHICGANYAKRYPAAKASASRRPADIPRDGDVTVPNCFTSRPIANLCPLVCAQKTKSLTAFTPNALFATTLFPMNPSGATASYAPAVDGQRFILAVAIAESSAPMIATVNWTAALKK